MAYAQNGRVRIRYEVEGSGPDLVLQHWSLATLEDWYECGFVDALKPDHRLILLDARGHGGSDKPHEKDAYALRHRVADIVAVLDALGLDRAHFFGYSMGGWIGFGIAEHAPERFHSLILGGQHPYEQSMEGLRQLLRAGIQQGREAFVPYLEGYFGRLSEPQKARARAFDLEALLAVASDRTSLEDAVASLTVPCLLLVGEQDEVYARAKRCVSVIPSVTFVGLPGLDHGTCLERPDLVVPFIRGFVAAVDDARRRAP